MSLKEQTLLTTYTDARCSDYIYYNAIFVNNTTTAAPILVNDKRSSIFIDDGLKYRYIGIIKRFLIDSFLIPLTRIDVPALYVITFRYLGVDYPSPIVLIPSSNTGQSDLRFGIFSVEQWVASLNATLLVCYTNAVAGGMPATFAPFFLYNGNTLSIVADDANYYPSNPGGCQIFVSGNIFTLLGGSCNYQFVVNNSPKDAILLIKSTHDNFHAAGFYYSDTNPPVPIAFASLTMAFTDNALVSLTTINQILIQAIATEIRPQIYYSTLQADSPSPNNLALQTIEDFIFVPNGRGKILYEPFIDRPFNLLSDRPITQFSFNVMYMNNDLQTFQALCTPGSTSNFKFQFRKDYSENTIGVLLASYRLLEKAAKKMGFS
jgi:hypothetical protein